MPRRRWSFFMSPLEHRFLRGLDDRYRGWLTPAGRVLLWAGICAWVLMLGGLQVPLVACFSFCAGALLCAAVLGAFFRPRLKLSRRLPPPPSAGDELSYRVVVENVGRLTARNVLIEERGLPFELRPAGEPEQIDKLAPGERAEVTLRLRCSARGAYALERLQGSSAFPAALVKWPRRDRRSDRLLVYPRFTPLEAFEVPHGRNYQPGGISIASNVGESTEFFGARDFREGDRPRDIHWPSFARTGRLIVKEFHEEYFVRLAMVLDVEARTARDEQLLETALQAAAGIADALARKDYIIDLFAAGGEIHHFRAGRALLHFDNLLQILACIEGGDRLDVPALEAALLPEARRLSAVVLVMMDWDDRRAQLVNRLKELGVAVRVLSVRAGRRPTGLAPEEVIELP
jgi:uncharacterized protein (DUF58 family)